MSHRKDRTALELERDPAYAFQVNGLLDLVGPWAGWRLRGRHLVSPDGDRISPGRLRGLLFLEAVSRWNDRKAARATADTPALQLQDDRERRTASP